MLEWEDDDALDGDFTFNMPTPAKGKVPAIDEPIDFGVAPNDPRFYQKSPNVEQELVNRQLDEEQGSNDNMDGVDTGSNDRLGSYLRIKDPLVVDPKPSPNSVNNNNGRAQGLLHKWGRYNNVPPGFDSRLNLPPSQVQEVVQRPVNMTEQTSISLYGVALIAGVSAAITIALIALGVGWWT